MKWQGFWSYVHADDEVEGGRITELARDVVNQFEMNSGEAISLFLDRDAIDWGENWKESIDTTLGSVAFFIAILTPRYFMSPECRRELQFFVRKATKLGMKDLVLPLLYVDVPELNSDQSTDDLVNLVREFQWVDWRDLRFSDRTSEPYRRAVVRLVTRLIEVNRQDPSLGEAESGSSEPATVVGNADDEPGMIDLLATTEESLPMLASTLDLISQEIQIIGQVMNEGSEHIRNADSQGKGYAARLLVARKVAARLKEPVARLELSANRFASQLHDVDQGFRIMIDQAPMAIEDDPESKEGVCTFFQSVKGMSSAAHTSFASVKSMIDNIEPIEKLSRDLRPTLRRLRQALTVMVEGREVINEWVTLIEGSGVECGISDEQ